MNNEIDYFKNQKFDLGKLCENNSAISPVKLTFSERVEEFKLIYFKELFHSFCIQFFKIKNYSVVRKKELKLVVKVITIKMFSLLISLKKFQKNPGLLLFSFLKNKIFLKSNNNFYFKRYIQKNFDRKSRIYWRISLLYKSREDLYLITI